MTPHPLLMFVAFIRPFVASNRLRKPSVRDSVSFSFIMALYVVGLALACFSFDPWLAS